jgi:hypothetical protein
MVQRKRANTLFAEKKRSPWYNVEYATDGFGSFGWWTQAQCGVRAGNGSLSYGLDEGQCGGLVADQQFHTVFGSLNDYVKGDLEIINDDPKYYAFSNVFDVASKSRPYEKVVVALNLGYVLEVLRAEGDSDWFAASHDEFAIVLDGTVEIQLVKLQAPDSIVAPDKKGAVKLKEAPVGRKMGWIRASRGHQALLPQGAAYRFRSDRPGVILLQTIEGELSVQKWADICYA